MTSFFSNGRKNVSKGCKLGNLLSPHHLTEFAVKLHFGEKKGEEIFICHAFLISLTLVRQPHIVNQVNNTKD